MPSPPEDAPIETPRLLLLAVTVEAVLADKRGHKLGDHYGVIVPSSWPPQYWDQSAMDYLCDRLRSYPEYPGWCRYVAVKQPGGALPVLVGGCGCTGPPQITDDVEIGYSILGEFRRQGYVTEAINALVPWIFAHPNVRSVCAQTYPHLAASIGVLRRCGFRMDGTGKDPGTVLFRRTRDADDEFNRA